MAEYLATDSDLTSVANAIRVKAEISGTLEFPDGFIAAINSISGGGTEVEPISITENGTYTAPSGKAYSPVTVNVSGGCVTNIVSGSFIGTESGQAMDITLPYTGNGYPIIVYVLVDGAGSNTSFKDLVQRYAIYSTFLFKSLPNDPPTYTYRDMAGYIRLFKSSATSATTYSGNGNANTASFWSNSNASSNQWVTVRSATKMSVYIANPSSFGFAANVKYNYAVFYSE